MAQDRDEMNVELEEDAAEFEDALAGEEAETPEAKAERLEATVVQMSADFENFKRASARREVESRERAVRRVIEDLLPVFDNFDRAIQAAGSARDVETMKIGLDFIGQQMQSTLGEIGVQAVESKGQMFDPARHDAIEEVADSGQPAGTVLEELSRGYVLNGSVLRAARVKVAG
jgi:molecular chaperone GrpE